MFRILSLMTLMLTGASFAHADNQPLGNPDGQYLWVATYAGQAQINDMNVLVTIDQAMNYVENIPGGDFHPMEGVQPSYRINVLSVEQPALRMTLPLLSHPVTIEGVSRMALLSDKSVPSPFSFVIYTQPDGTLEAFYTQKVDSGSINKGDFVLNPVPHVFHK
jgi:hypothetical protein